MIYIHKLTGERYELLDTEKTPLFVVDKDGNSREDGEEVTYKLRQVTGSKEGEITYVNKWGISDFYLQDPLSKEEN